MMGPYERLANAIVEQAAKDWRSAVKTLKKRPRNEAARIMREDCEHFFLSDWFEELTDVDGAFILRKLKEEAELYDE